MASSFVGNVVEAAKQLVGADAGHQALRHLDAILAKEPESDPDLFSRCTRELAALRNALILHAREPAVGDAAHRRLAHVNATISVVLAGHFPLGPVPWEELHRARDWLAEVIGHTPPA